MELIKKTPTNNLLRICVKEGYDFTSELHVLEDLNSENGNDYTRCLSTNGLIIMDCFSSFNDKTKTILSFEEPGLAMVFHIEGDSKISYGGNDLLDPHNHLSNRVHNIELLPRRHIEIENQEKIFIDLFVVLLSREFFLKLFPNENDIYNGLISHEKSNRNRLFSKNYLHLNQDIIRIIDSIRKCTRKGCFYKLFIELKITELLLLQFEQYYLLNSAKDKKKELTESDKEKLQHAKKILEGNYENPPTIKQLSLIVGMNQSKLKSTFKKKFELTIHTFIIHLRMEKAYQLIIDQELLLREIALKVGFQNPSHFSAAFKKYYGFVPSKILSNK